ncbi:MAG: hypothetical protein WCP93_03570 [Candidatus Berkelbacteria bacterium]
MANKPIKKTSDGEKTETKIPLEWIITPPQIRQTIDPEHIKRLAHSIIATQGCENPPIVYKFDETGFKVYLAMIETIWGIHSTIDDYQAVEQINHHGLLVKYYYPVVAGACRTHALRFIRDNGCDDCREKLNNSIRYQCFDQHFPCREITVRLSCTNNTHDALRDMFNENIYQPPSTHELAMGIALYFTFMKIEDPKLTFAKFSRECVGWSATKISEAMRYKDLPDYIRQAVEKGQILYGMAVQLSRLQSADCSTFELEDWYIKIVSGRLLTVKSIEEQITKVIKAKKSGQFDLETLMLESQTAISRREKFRKPVLLDTLELIYAMKRWLEKVLDLFTQGLLSTKFSPFTQESVTHGMIAVWQIAKLSLKHMTWLKENQKQEMDQTFTKAIEMAKELQSLHK